MRISQILPNTINSNRATATKQLQQDETQNQTQRCIIPARFFLGAAWIPSYGEADKIVRRMTTPQQPMQMNQARPALWEREPWKGVGETKLFTLLENHLSRDCRWKFLVSDQIPDSWQI
jgi:hypothetical protein